MLPVHCVSAWYWGPASATAAVKIIRLPTSSEPTLPPAACRRSSHRRQADSCVVFCAVQNAAALSLVETRRESGCKHRIRPGKSRLLKTIQPAPSYISPPRKSAQTRPRPMFFSRRDGFRPGLWKFSVLPGGKYGTVGTRQALPTRPRQHTGPHRIKTGRWTACPQACHRQAVAIILSSRTERS